MNKAPYPLLVAAFIFELTFLAVALWMYFDEGYHGQVGYCIVKTCEFGGRQ